MFNVAFTSKERSAVEKRGLNFSLGLLWIVWLIETNYSVARARWNKKNCDDMHTTYQRQTQIDAFSFKPFLAFDDICVSKEIEIEEEIKS